jgi:hypothetical protein
MTESAGDRLHEGEPGLGQGGSSSSRSRGQQVLHRSRSNLPMVGTRWDPGYGQASRPGVVRSPQEVGRVIEGVADSDGRVEPAPRRHQLAPAEYQTGLPGVHHSTMLVAPVDLSILRDPVRWTRWRRSVRRLGPYAPEYEGRSLVVRPLVLNLSAAGVALAVAMVIVMLGSTSVR